MTLQEILHTRFNNLQYYMSYEDLRLIASSNLKPGFLVICKKLLSLEFEP